MIFQVSPNWHRSCHVEGWKLSLHNKNGKSQGLCEFRGGNAKSENYGNFTCNLERIWSIIDHQWWYTINMNGKSMLSPKKYSMDKSPAKMITLVNLDNQWYVINPKLDSSSISKMIMRSCEVAKHTLQNDGRLIKNANHAWPKSGSVSLKSSTAALRCGTGNVNRQLRPLYN